MSVSYWLDKSSDSKKVEVDVLIIGGGIAGLSSLYWLTKKEPELKVALVEKGDLAWGASGRNAGFITCGSVEHFNRLVSKHGEKEALEIWQFSEKNLELLEEEIIQDQTEELLYERKGSFSLASTEEELSELKKSAELMRNLGIEVEEVEKKAIETRLSAEGFVGGIKYLKDGSVHPVKLIERIKEKTQDAQVFTNEEVFSIETQSDKKVIKTQKRTYETTLVVLATNGFSSLLDPFFAQKIFPTRGQILCTEKLPLFLESPCYCNFVLDYFRQLPSGEVLIGGFRQLQKDVEVGYSDETTEVIQKALHDFLLKHLPKVREAKITHRWSGIMGFSVDGQPMIGAKPSDPQTYFIGGFTAHGIGLAFHAGLHLANLVLGNEIPSFISAKRFQ